VNVVELFPCSGGMAEGLRRGGIDVDMAFDYDPDAVASYTKNLGHAPVRMDVRDLLRMVESGWSPGSKIDLFVADPPCTPWSRAGKRKGQEDARDLIGETVRLVRLLRPTAWLIANVPGLDDGPNWPIVQKTIGSLTAEGYCIDFQRLNASAYGVPQHRVRPFWFGHPMRAPHIAWPEPTHADPKSLRTGALPGVRELAPWVTCRQALQHLSAEDLGVPVRLRWRGANGKQVASVPDSPARVVGTSNLSDGNVLAHPTEAVREGKRSRKEPGKKPRASHVDAPADVVTTRSNGGGNVVFDGPDHRPSHPDAPARTLTKNSHSDGALLQIVSLVPNDRHPGAELDAPAPTLGARDRGGQGAQVLVVHERHPVSESEEPAFTISASDGGGSKGARCLTWPWDRPSTTLQSDDRLPPPCHHDENWLGADGDRARSHPNAVKLSEKAAAILQGFPEGWLFAGDTKKARWAQIGMAMPPPLAEAVARSIKAWFDKQEGRSREAVKLLNGGSP
jgi:site-specific DNA-cytosine methylase